MAGRAATDDRVGQNTPSPEAEPDCSRRCKAKLQGTWNYYGLIGNYRRMQLSIEATCRMLHKWLNRRSQRPSMTWRAFNRMLARFQVPRPRIVENVQAGNALPEGTEFLPTAAGLPAAGGKPAGDMRERVDLKSPVREYRPPGSVRGAPGNRRPYLDKGLNRTNLTIWSGLQAGEQGRRLGCW